MTRPRSPFPQLPMARPHPWLLQILCIPILATLPFFGSMGCSDDASTSPGDRIPPDRPADFTAATNGPGSVRFSWTSTGDNGLEGPASGFEIRMSEAPIEGGDWESANLLVAGHCRPPGQHQQEEASGILPGSWTFTLRIGDEAGNLSPLSEPVRVEVEGLAPPPPVADLRGVSSDSEESGYWLGWTVPTAAAGEVTAYDMRYSRSPLTLENWADAALVPNLPTPSAPGETDKVRIEGLDYRTTYFAALRTAAAPPSWSELSNVFEWTTGYWVEVLREAPGYSSISEVEWAPDGGSLVYVYDEREDDLEPRLVRIPRRRGAPVQLTDGHAGAYSPAFSPDGRSLAYVRERKEETEGTTVMIRELAIMEASPGATPRVVPLPPLHTISELDWSPNGLELVYSARTGAGDETGLWIVPRYGGDVRTLYVHPYFEIRNPVWSPNGSEIAFTMFGSLWVVPAAGGEPDEIISDGAVTHDIAWTADGRRLTYGLANDGWLSAQFVIVRRDGEEIHRNSFPRSRVACSHALSPNGRELAYTGCLSWVPLIIMGPMD